MAIQSVVHMLYLQL